MTRLGAGLPLVELLAASALSGCSSEAACKPLYSCSEYLGSPGDPDAGFSGWC